MFLKGPILYVEDDEDDQFLLTQAMKAVGVANKICFFSNGEAALTYLKTTQERPFLILCDINMPVMNGIELARTIYENEFLRHKSIPFVYLTTAANPELVKTAYEMPVQGFYQKPATNEELQAQLRLIIDYWTSCLRP